jgi:peptidoglycan/LPS O-acetylase OafA/YrhL
MFETETPGAKPVLPADGGRRPSAAAKYDNVQYMRGLAAILVIVSHCFALAPLGPIGVAIFFVISGFIMTVTSWGAFERPGASANFLKRRFLRIFPVYWIALSIKMLIDSRPKDLGWVAGSYLLLPIISPDGLIEPIHGVGWSLVWEMIFYYVFAASLAAPRPVGLALNLATLAILALMGALIPEFESGAWHGCQIFPLFMAGILIGAAARRFGSRAEASHLALVAAPVAVLLLILTCFGVFFASPYRGLWQIATAGLLIASFVFLPNIPPRGRILNIAHLIGDASYSLYLIHPLTTAALSFVFKKAGLPRESLLYMSVALVAAIVSGLVFYRLVEKPLLDRLNIQFRQPRLKPSAEAVAS